MPDINSTTLEGQNPQTILNASNLVAWIDPSAHSNRIGVQEYEFSSVPGVPKNAMSFKSLTSRSNGQVFHNYSPIISSNDQIGQTDQGFCFDKFSLNGWCPARGIIFAPISSGNGKVSLSGTHMTTMTVMFINETTSPSNIWLLAESNVTATTPVADDASKYVPTSYDTTSGWYVKFLGGRQFRIVFNDALGRSGASASRLESPIYQSSDDVFVLTIDCKTTENGAIIEVLSDSTLLDTITLTRTSPGRFTASSDTTTLLTDSLFDPFPKNFSAVGSAIGRIESAGEVFFGDHLIYDQPLLSTSRNSVVSQLKSKWVKHNSPIVFDRMYGRIGFENQAFETVVSINNAQDAAVEALFSQNTSWSLEQNPYDSRFWKIRSTQALKNQRALTLRVWATNQNHIAQKDFQVIVGSAGVVDYEQKLIFYGPDKTNLSTQDLNLLNNDSVDSVKVWLDPSRSEHVDKDSATGLVSSLIDPYRGISWDVSSSEAITTTSTAFNKTGLSFSDAVHSTGFNTRIAISESDRVKISTIYTGINSSVDSGETGISFGESGFKAAMVVRYDAPAVGDLDGSFYAMPSNRYDKVNNLPLSDKPLTEMGSFGISVKKIGQDSACLVFKSSRLEDLANSLTQGSDYQTAGSFIDGRVETPAVLNVGQSAVIGFIQSSSGSLQVRINSQPQPLRLKGTFLRENTYRSSLIGLFDFTSSEPLVNKSDITQRLTAVLVGSESTQTFPVVFSDESVKGECLKLGGRRPYYLRADYPSFNPDGQDWSVDFIAKLIDFPEESNSDTYLLRLGNGVFELKYSTIASGGLLTFKNSSSRITVDGHSLNTHRGQPVHFRLDRTSVLGIKNIRLFINNALVHSSPEVSQWTDGRIMVGGTPNAGTGYLGLISQLRILKGTIDAPTYRVNRYSAGEFEYEPLDVLIDDALLGQYFKYQKSIGMFGSPNGYVFGTIGTLCVFSGETDLPHFTAIEQYLASNWLGQGTEAPDIETISNTTAVSGEVFTTLLRVDTLYPESVSIVISDTSEGIWTAVRSVDDSRTWRIEATGLSQVGDYRFTVTASESGYLTTKSFDYTVIPLPAVPVIGLLSPSYGQMGKSYSGVLSVKNFNVNQYSTITILATEGTNWTVTRLSSDPDKCLIEGTLPASASTLQLTFRVRSYSSDGNNFTEQVKVVPFQVLDITAGTLTKYPFDRTGTAPENAIVGEKHYVTLTNGHDRQMIVPIMAPFFENSVTVWYKGILGDKRKAIKDVDYALVYEIIDVRDLCSSPIYCAIAPMNDLFEGELIIDYQHIGGEFVLDRREVYSKLAARILEPRKVRVSDLIGVPKYLPAEEHSHNDYRDLVGFNSMIQSIRSISSRLDTRPESSDLVAMRNHVLSEGESHAKNKNMIGLSNVPNFSTATTTDATDSSNTNTLLTPSSASAAAKSGLKTATATQLGIAKLNLGNSTGDDVNSTDALTPMGLLRMATNQGTNAIKQATSAGQVIAKVTPFPLDFPFFWRGVFYSTTEAFVNAVATYCDVWPLTYNKQEGHFYFPSGITPPDLVTYKSVPAAVKTNHRTSELTTNLPISYYRNASGEQIVTYREISVDDTVDTPLSVPVVTQY
jgi:hypothetical protein